MKTYNNPNGIRRAIAEVLKIGIEEVELTYTGDGFAIVRPEGAEPDEQEVANWTPPVVEPPPVDPVAQLEAQLASNESQAARAITRLKATAAAAMVGGGMAPGDAYAAGSALVVQHSAHIQAFILAGGNPVAAQALLDAITASPPAWWSDPMEALFSAGLGL